VQWIFQNRGRQVKKRRFKKNAFKVESAILSSSAILFIKKKEERRWRQEKSGVTFGLAAVSERPTTLYLLLHYSITLRALRLAH